jgi:hypothetical protein
MLGVPCSPRLDECGSKDAVCTPLLRSEVRRVCRNIIGIDIMLNYLHRSDTTSMSAPEQPRLTSAAMGPGNLFAIMKS